LMDAFLDQARNLYFTLRDKMDIESFDRVFDAIGYFSRVHSKASLDLVNLETVFSAFEMARLLGKIPEGCQTDADTLISDLKRVIVVTLERSITPKSGVPGDGYGELADLLHTLRGSGRGSAVVTFNYDLLCDYAFGNKGLNLLYGLTEMADGSEPRLLKLHGSLNWFLQDKKIETHSFQVRNDRTSSGDLISQLIVSRFNKNEVEASPFLVPPTWNKGDHYGQIQPVWKAAAQELAKAHNIFVIGFSMPETDSFFHYLYALGSESREQLRRFFVFNPDEKVMERFERLLGTGALKRFKAFSGNPGHFELVTSRIKSELSIK